MAFIEECRFYGYCIHEELYNRCIRNPKMKNNWMCWRDGVMVEEKPDPNVALREKLAKDFQPFFDEMIDEMVRHHPENGESWKTSTMRWLKLLLGKSMDDWFLKPDNIDHLADVGNFCAMVYMKHNLKYPDDS
jgi:hypothetical protein